MFKIDKYYKSRGGVVYKVKEIAEYYMICEQFNSGTLVIFSLNGYLVLPKISFDFLSKAQQIKELNSIFNDDKEAALIDEEIDPKDVSPFKLWSRYRKNSGSIEVVIYKDKQCIFTILDNAKDKLISVYTLNGKFVCFYTSFIGLSTSEKQSVIYKIYESEFATSILSPEEVFVK